MDGEARRRARAPAPPATAHAATRKGAPRTSPTWPRIARAGVFCVNILGAGQGDLCRAFAVSGADKFAGVEYDAAPATGSPRLAGAPAWIDCVVHAVHTGGDHLIVVGRVEALGQSLTLRLPDVVHADGGDCPDARVDLRRRQREPAAAADADQSEDRAGDAPDPTSQHSGHQPGQPVEPHDGQATLPIHDRPEQTPSHPPYVAPR